MMSGLRRWWWRLWEPNRITVTAPPWVGPYPVVAELGPGEKQ